MTATACWTLVGSVGGPGFGAVEPWGRVTSPAGPWSLDWWIGADDGWHVPAEQASTRQRRSGPGVIETRVKVPSGDAVQRVYGVGGPGDALVVEIENDSPLPFGVALILRGAPPLFFSRPPFSRGVPLDAPPGPVPADAEVVHLPVAHRTSLRFAVALAPSARGTIDPDSLPSLDDVSHAWARHLDTGMRVALPDIQPAVDAARASLLLFDDGVEPQPAPFTGSEPADRVILVAALDRWGFDRHASELRHAIARRHRRRHQPASLAPAAAIEAVAAMVREASPTTTWSKDGEGHHGARTAQFLLAVRDLLIVEGIEGIEGVEGNDSDAALLPGLPGEWRGAPIEVHQAPLGDGTVSFAVRWHGERAALMWSIEGPARAVTCPALAPGWSSRDGSGEVLLEPSAM